MWCIGQDRFAIGGPPIRNLPVGSLANQQTINVPDTLIVFSKENTASPVGRAHLRQFRRKAPCPYLDMGMRAVA